MIIKIIPETDMGKAKLKEVEHRGVKEFFMFGTETDEDDTLLDFHDWTGSFNYLIRYLCYFLHRIEVEERENKITPRGNSPGKMIKYGANDMPQSIRFPQPLKKEPLASQLDLGFPQASEQNQEETQGEQIVEELGIDNNSPQIKVINFPKRGNNKEE